MAIAVHARFCSQSPPRKADGELSRTSRSRSCLGNWAVKWAGFVLGGRPLAVLPKQRRRRMESAHVQSIGMFLCGDVMTGRGIDQVLAYPGNPALYEPC